MTQDAAAQIADVLEGRKSWAIIHGDCREILPLIPPIEGSVAIMDPAYSEHVHGKQRRMLRGSGGRTAKGQKSGRGQIGPAPLSFEALTPEVRLAAAKELARIITRWVLAFSDAESVHLWERDLVASGMKHIRVGAWIKEAGQPQYSGDRPAVGFEAIEIAHGSKWRCRWSGGGHPAVWSHLIATDRNGKADRRHDTQKPLPLMIELVDLFTDKGTVVIDPFCGFATTGIACRRSGRPFIGIEKDEKKAADAQARMEADERGLLLRDAEAGQVSIFDVLKKVEAGR